MSGRVGGGWWLGRCNETMQRGGGEEMMSRTTAEWCDCWCEWRGSLREGGAGDGWGAGDVAEGGAQRDGLQLEARPREERGRRLAWVMKVGAWFGLILHFFVEHYSGRDFCLAEDVSKGCQWPSRLWVVGAGDSPSEAALGLWRVEARRPSRKSMKMSGFSPLWASQRTTICVHSPERNCF